MVAPKQGDPKPIWYDVTVSDIAQTYSKAIGTKCAEIQPITEIETHGVKTAMFANSFGYIWQLHEVVREVGFEDCVKANENQH